MLVVRRLSVSLLLDLFLRPTLLPSQSPISSKEKNANVYGCVSAYVVEFSNRQNRRSFTLPLASSILEDRVRTRLENP